MLIEGLLNVIKAVLDTLLFFKIPSLPEQVNSYIENGFSYISSGAGILANYTPLEYLLTLFFLILAIDVAIQLYHFVMWVIRKIPFTNIS